jgi:thioredoxin reductase
MVIGFSVSGIGAALELASQGVGVGIMDYQPDTYVLGEHLLVQGTPLSDRKLSGEEFQLLALRELRNVGVGLVSDSAELFLNCNRIVADARGGQFQYLDDFSGRMLGSKSAVFAPGGSEPGLPATLDAWRFIGRGLSYSAWADGSFYSDRAVTVLGCGYHAFEQAAMLTQWASSITVLCPEPRLHPAFAREKHQHWSLIPGSEIRSILTDDGESVSAILIQTPESKQTIRAAGLFVAQDPVANWSVWEEPGRAEQLAHAGRIHLAGIVTGTDYSNHTALYEDGVRAAREYLEIR